METEPIKPTRPKTPKVKPTSPPTTIACFDPATLESLGDLHAMSASEVRERIERARLAQRGWAQTSFGERRRVLARMLDYILDHADELCRTIARDAGKTLENAML